ncbi:hypothetical protein J8380_00835 [Candidatus Thiothrix anitrata]|uniref:SD-repeat containing protein B domain-containing protein n=1 Tax=Candidatus Thiothrix anitrata TaxID=2823902 RepID=A0ABX7X2Q1_9GAMM|nr:hypothetical protein J8380_00835 [Candidatus Thiothrix anitrata]
MKFVPPTGMTFVTAKQGSDTTLDSDPAADGEVKVTVISGVGNQTVDAGIVPAKLGDYVWLDLNGDGTQGAGEPAVAGVTVNLLDKESKPVKDAGGNPLTALTDATGKYQFTVLPVNTVSSLYCRIWQRLPSSSRVRTQPPIRMRI